MSFGSFCYANGDSCVFIKSDDPKNDADIATQTTQGIKTAVGERGFWIIISGALDGYRSVGKTLDAITDTIASEGMTK